MGVRRKSGEVVVATNDRMFNARSVRTTLVEDRWSGYCSVVRNVPWN